MEGIKNLPSIVKQGYYIVKLDIKKAYLHLLVDPQYRDLFRFVWKGSHYRWKTMPFGLSTAPRIFTMLLRPVLRMLRDIKVSVIAYLDDLLIVGSTKEECLSNFKKTMDLLVKLGFKLNLEKSVLEPTQSITFLGLQIDSVSMKLLVPKEKKKSVIKEIRNFLKLNCCFPRKLAGLKGKLIVFNDAVIPFRLYTRRTNKFHSQCLTLAYGDWDQSFSIPQDSNQELQLATEERSVQSHPTSVRSNTDGSVRISPEPSNEQLLNNQNEFTPPRMESMEAMSGLPTTHSFAFYPGEDELIHNLVSDDSSSSSSSSSSHVSSSTGNIPRSIMKFGLLNCFLS
ncbi:hypothetical protein ACTFIR_005734 [Dictyostelium discoideum]